MSPALVSSLAGFAPVLADVPIDIGRADSRGFDRFCHGLSFIMMGDPSDGSIAVAGAPAETAGSKRPPFRSASFAPLAPLAATGGMKPGGGLVTVDRRLFADEPTCRYSVRVCPWCVRGVSVVCEYLVTALRVI